MGMDPRGLCLVAQQLRSVRSGVGTYARLLCEGLARLGIPVVFATYEEECDPEAFPGFRWMPLGRRPRLDPTPGGFWTLGRRFRETWLRSPPPVEVCHFLDAREGHAFLRDGISPLPPRVVGTVHDDYAARAPRSPTAFFGRCADPIRRFAYYGWLRRLEAASLPRFDLLLANSEATGASLEEVYGVPRDRWRLTHLTIGRPVSTEARVLEGRPALIFLGGNWYRKGLDRVLRSLALCREALPHPVLHVCGEDRKAAGRIASLSASLGLERSVRFHGRVEPSEIERMLRGADLMVQPSRREALGLAYLEAFQAGLPVIAAEGGGVTEIVQHGTSGWIAGDGSPVSLARALTTLSRDHALRQRLRDGGKRILASRTPERMLLETLEAYGLSAGASFVRGRSPKDEVEDSAPANEAAAPQDSPLTSSRARRSLAPKAEGANLRS